MMKFKNYTLISLGAFLLIFLIISSCARTPSPALSISPPSQEQPTSKAEFKIGELTINPQNIHAGEQLQVSANIQNTSSQDEIYCAILKIDDQITDRKDLKIVANQANTVDFIIAGLTEGEHTIDIGSSEATVSISPSDKIAFVADRGNKYGFEILTMYSDGTHITDITKSGSRDVWPTWSPDGTKIAFGSVREWHGMRSIYVMDADGQNIKCLTPEKTDCEFPSWSPDGSKIAYCSSKLASSGTEYIALDIFIMNTDGSDKTAVTQHGAITTNACPSWFPNSQRIAYVTNRGGLWEIYSINIDGSDAIKYDVCIEHQYGLKFPSGQFPRIAVSPDGESLAFDYIDNLKRSEIYVLSIDTGEIKKLTNQMAGNSYTPSWSPDGKRIAFSSEIANGTGIFIVDVDSNNIPRFTNQYGYFPVWQR